MKFDWKIHEVNWQWIEIECYDPKDNKNKISTTIVHSLKEVLDWIKLSESYHNHKCKDCLKRIDVNCEDCIDRDQWKPKKKEEAQNV
jgi:hypothetical protein